MSENVKRARREMMEKRFLGNPKGAKVGGGMRRKMVAGSRPTDQGRISATLKRFNFTELKNFLEVNIFVRNQSDETSPDVIHITEPKILVSPSNFTAQVTGRVEINQVSNYFPDIIDQLGPDLRERMNFQEPEPQQQQEPSMGGSGMGSTGGMGGMEGKDEDDSEDDMPGMDDDDGDGEDIPELAGNFDVDD